MTRTSFRPRLSHLDDRIVPAAIAMADLAVTIIDGQDPVVAGTNLTYSIAVTNNGPNDAHDVFLRDLIPVNTSVLSFTAPAGWTTTSPPSGVYGAVTATLPTLAFGAPTQIFTLTIHVMPIAFSNLVLNNNATITSSTSDPDTANNDVTEPTVLRPYPTPLVTGADAGGGPHVKVYDPFTGALKFSFFAYDASFTGGVRVASADVNHDYIPDIITGAGPGGGPNVRAFSGASYAKIRDFYAYEANFTGGVYVAAGDLDKDGHAEIITGTAARPVNVFRGTDSVLVQSFYGYGPTFAGSVRVGIADLGGDGQLDILTGAGPGGGPHAIARQGKTLDILTSFYAYDPGFTGGVWVG
jgi:uncharacterized repeat protein (TIGR01451 family)